MGTNTVVLTKTKTTKNKVVYSGGADSGFDSVYIDKNKLPAEAPETIKVTLSWDE